MLGLSLGSLITRLTALIVGLTLHEFSHAAVATALGDETPRMYGRLSLNPLRHLDPIGSLMLVVAGFGWAKPVPINPYALDKRTDLGVFWVSLAGPFSNFMLAVLAAIPLRFHLVSLSGINATDLSLGYFLIDFMWINLTLALFNLIPISPLDGEKIASSVLPPFLGQALDSLRNMGPYLLIIIFFVLPMVGVDVFGALITPVLSKLSGILIGVQTF